MSERDGGRAPRQGATNAAPLSISVNGEPRQVSAGATVADLLASVNAAGCASAAGSAASTSSPARCAVEVNREIVPRSRHAEHRLEDGDRVEIVTFVGGG